MKELTNILVSSGKYKRLEIEYAKIKAQAEVLEERLKLAKERYEVLQEDLQRVLNPPKPSFSNVPLYISEDEEDVQHMRELSIISAKEAEDILRELQFENPNIVLDEPEGDISLY